MNKRQEDGMTRALIRHWRTFSSWLAGVNTRLLLTLVFFLVIFPIGMIMRISGKNPIGSASRDGNWIRRESEESLERQF